MILGSNDNKGNAVVALYKSNDLYNWDFINVLARSDGNMGICWECPDRQEQ